MQWTTAGYDLRVTSQGDLVADTTTELYKQPKKIAAIDSLGSIECGEIDATIPRAWVRFDSRMATEAYQIRERAYGDQPRQPWVGRIDPKSLEIEWLFPCHATGGFYGEDEDGPFLIVSNPEPYRERSRLQRLALDSGEIIWSKLIFAKIAVIEPLHDLGLMVFTAPAISASSTWRAGYFWTTNL